MHAMSEYQPHSTSITELLQLRFGPTESDYADVTPLRPVEIDSTVADSNSVMMPADYSCRSGAAAKHSRLPTLAEYRDDITTLAHTMMY